MLINHVGRCNGLGKNLKIYYCKSKFFGNPGISLKNEMSDDKYNYPCFKYLYITEVTIKKKG